MAPGLPKLWPKNVYSTEKIFFSAKKTIFQKNDFFPHVFLRHIKRKKAEINIKRMNKSLKRDVYLFIISK